MAATTNRLPRLYVELELDGTSLALDESEAHYLGHVLRLALGRGLVVFNGRGAEREARVDSLQRRGAVLALGAVRAPLPESPLDLTLLQALPKSAEFLGELRDQFGNLGLAAAAYNAGPRRVQEWLAGRGPLPGETRAYVRIITDRSVIRDEAKKR